MKRQLLFCLLSIMLVTILSVSCSSESHETTCVETSAEKVTSQETTLEDLPSSQPITTSSSKDSSTIPVSTAAISTLSPVVHTISSEEAKQMMDQGNVTVVDVRRIDEYEAGHVPGAILVPNETILTEAASKFPNKDAVLLIYCRSGRRSAEAAQKLLSLGYYHVYDFGGILDWQYDITK